MKHDFEFVPKTEWMPVKKELIKLINNVQKELKSYFTFSFDFIGSSSRNLITRDIKSNIGFDFDLNIYPNKDLPPKELKNILRTTLDKFSKIYGYDFGEDSTRVITIKFKDHKKSKIIHSVDFAIVRNTDKGQQYVRFNKKQKSYYWEYQPDGYELEKKIYDIKQNNLWQELKELYLYKKNTNADMNKKSRSLFAESVNEIYQQFFNEDKDEYYDEYEDKCY